MLCLAADRGRTNTPKTRHGVGKCHSPLVSFRRIGKAGLRSCPTELPSQKASDRHLVCASLSSPKNGLFVDDALKNNATARNHRQFLLP